MTLVRTALRLCVVEALKGATIGEKRIYDSRMEEIAPETFSDDARATAIILTDKDDGKSLSEQNGGPPFGRHIDLTIEFGMVQRIGSGPDDIIYPNTDDRLEAALDFFEFQALRRLQHDTNNPLSIAFRKFWRIVKYDCHRQIFDDAGMKVACRILILTCYGSDDKVRVYNSDTETMPSGYLALPQPLQTIAQLMPVGSSGKSVCDLLASAIDTLTVPMFEGMDIQVDASREDQGGSDMVDVDVEIQSALSVAETVATGGPVVIDYQRGTFQHLILAGDVPAMSVVGWPRAGKTGRLILKVINTGNYAINAWPVTTLWTGGDEPVVSVGAGKKDVFALVSGDGGIEFFANVIGQDYSP